MKMALGGSGVQCGDGGLEEEVLEAFSGGRSVALERQTPTVFFNYVFLSHIET